MLLDILATTSSTSILPYVILFLATFVEGPIATLTGGALSSSGLLSPIWAFFAVVCANLTADMGWYNLGKFGKVNWLTKLAPKVGINSRKVDELTDGIYTHAPKLLFLSKFTSGFPIPTLIATGIGKVPVKRWILQLVSGELIKSAMLVSLGYFFSKTLQKTEGTIHSLIWVVTGILLVALVAWFKFFAKRKKTLQNN